MTELTIGAEALEAVADEIYRGLGIRGEGSGEQEYEDFKELRSQYVKTLGIDQEGLIEWCIAEANSDCTNTTSPLAGLPMFFVMNAVLPVLATAYECGILIGLELGKRLGEQAPEAPR
jgi:hypothetical protein